MIAATTLFAASCTDFDDYNEAYTNVSAEGTQTLWQNISSRSELSQFADLLTRAGYDTELQNSRFYTVWAPVNGTYNYDSLKAVDKTLLVERFVKNHVADYNYSVSPGIEEQRAYALNGKSFDLLMENGGYTFDGIKLNVTNVPSSNGILHTMNGYAPYLRNIYEYVFDRKEENGLLASYLEKYETEYLDETKSVAGPIDEFGRQTYSDSVMVTENLLTQVDPRGIYDGSFTLNACIDKEDSLYTMLFPTDKAYQDAEEWIKSYYNYPSKIEYYPLSTTGRGEKVTQSNIDFEALADSLTRWNIARSLVYSHGSWYNQWVPEVDGRSPWQNDTICTTTERKLSNGPEILSHTIGDPIKLSNGFLREVDTLAFKSWDAWCGERVLTRPYSSSSITEVNVTELEFNKEAGEYISRYYELAPTSDKASFYYDLGGVYSTAYNVYVIFVPAAITKAGIAEHDTVVCFNATINYVNENENNVSTNFTYIDAGMDYERPTERSIKDDDLITNPVNIGKIDTVFVGSIDFPYSYAGTGCSPYLQVALRYGIRSSLKPITDYCKKLRVAGVILRPKEYDDYLKNNE